MKNNPNRESHIKTSQDAPVRRDNHPEGMIQESQQPPPSEVELLWRQYELQVELYKQYLDLVLRFNVFYYAITGGILSFFFSREQKGRYRTIGANLSRWSYKDLRD
jgi:hypothetical protein